MAPNLQLPSPQLASAALHRGDALARRVRPGNVLLLQAITAGLRLDYGQCGACEEEPGRLHCDSVMPARMIGP